MLHALKEFFLIPVDFFRHATRLTYVSLGIAAVIGILYFRIMFRRRDDFDWRLTGVELKWTKWKLVAWLMLCLLSYLTARDRLPHWFPSVFPSE